MSPVIGIDLGTTNTVVAVVRDGQASAIADGSGQTLIPSVVSFHPNGTVLVGQAAKLRRSVDTENTIYSIKRLLGRSWNSEDARQARARLPFELREGPGQAALVMARGESYTLPEISAFVLRKARSVAEAHLGTSVERAVVTVPANFNDLQRAATKVAGRVAGLEVMRILNEPTAAALGYGFGKATSERLAIYDFGGGTFDITFLDLSDNVFEVLATAGNTFLGGDDIDLAIADRMASEFLVQHRSDLRENLSAFERLRAAAEQIKHELSLQDQAQIDLQELAFGPGGKAYALNFAMTRAELERLVTPLVDRTFDVCREALGIARAKAQDFDQVVLVGGSTRVPLVRRRVEEFFGKPVRSNVSPDEVVALGAAIQGHALSGADRPERAVPPPPAAARRVATIAGPGPGTGLDGARRMNTIPGVPLPGAKPPFIAPAGRIPRGLGIGLSPSAEEEARIARQSVADILPVVDATPRREAPLKVAPKRDESVAFALHDEEIQEIAGPPPRPARQTQVQPRSGTDTPYPKDEISQRAHLADLEDEPTHAGRVSVETLALATGPLAPTPGGSKPRPPGPPAPLAAKTQGGVTAWQLPSPSVPPVSLPAAEHESPPIPLLVDVTPLTLCVETVRGFCDSVITRNTPVPCEQTREFVTAADGQTLVRVRVAQGESRHFEENTLLGEVELSDLTHAPRGGVQIAVTFALDTNGMLNVSAQEMPIGRRAVATLRLLGLPDSREVEQMADKHQARHSP